MYKLRRLFIVFVLGVVAFFVVVNADRFAHPFFTHSLFDSQVVGKHYFINDIVGVSPAKPSLPYAYLLSHSARADVLLVDSDRLQLAAADSYGLSQDKKIVGWGALNEPVEGKGLLQLYYYRTFVVGVYQPEGGLQPERTLQVNIPWPAIYGKSGNLDIEHTESEGKTSFKVTFNGAGSFWIETQPPPSDGFSIEFALTGFSPGEVLVGAEQVVVKGSRFELSTKDLHSLAMTELDGDDGAEFSVVRGGIRGRLGAIDPSARDLLVDSDTGNDIADDYIGFMKNGCPGRQSAWVDIDSDGDLDLYVSCGRPNEPTAHFPNQLFLNSGTGFIESGKTFGIDFETFGSFRFIDWDGDLDPDLWWAGADGQLRYFENNNNRFTLRQTFSGVWKGGYRSPQLLIRDMSNNGLPDLLVAHPFGNRLLLNTKGESELKLFSELGLPDETMVVHLADIDLDGRVDLLTATQGVYLNQDSLQFTQKKGEVADGAFVYDARLVSFADEEGRQFLLGLRSCLPGKLCGARRVLLSFVRKFLPLPLSWLEMSGLIEPYDWTVQVLHRKPQDGTHKEVAISIQGTQYNPNAIGGRVDLQWGQQKQSHWVGESESSLYSMADLNMYFSLPVSQNVRGRAIWPDGCTATFLLRSTINKKRVKRPSTCL